MDQRQASLQLREHIIDASRRIFSRKGAAEATLEDVAQEAGISDSAIYENYRNKNELFVAMRSQVQLPLMEIMGDKLSSQDADPFDQLEQFILGSIRALALDHRVSATYRIMFFKCEYVGELEELHHQEFAAADDLLAHFEDCYRRAARRQQLDERWDPTLASLDTLAFLGGLVRFWVGESDRGKFRDMAERLVIAHLNSKRRIARRVAREHRAAG